MAYCHTQKQLNLADRSIVLSCANHVVRPITAIQGTAKDSR